jgi:hypothetical protein
LTRSHDVAPCKFSRLASYRSFICGSHTRLWYSDISSCEVVTAWAAGCSWNEALELADAPPGDLVRTLSRALDGLRQLGNLPFTPLRRGDLGDTSSTLSKVAVPRGLHPEVRKLCRDAAKAINRYPVKDYLTFEIDEEDDDLIDTEEGNAENESESPSIE